MPVKFPRCVWQQVVVGKFCISEFGSSKFFLISEWTKLSSSFLNLQISFKIMPQFTTTLVNKAKKPTPFISKNTFKHRNDDIPEEDNHCETGNDIKDQMQASVRKTSKNGKQGNMKLNIFMVKSPILFTMVRLAILKWAGQLDQKEQLVEFTAAQDPGLVYLKVENKGVLEEAMMLKDKKLRTETCFLVVECYSGVWGYRSFLF